VTLSYGHRHVSVLTKLTPVITIGVGAILSFSALGIAARERQAIATEKLEEIQSVGRQVRAIATALAPELGPARSAAAASEGLEAIFSGGWCWRRLQKDGTASAGPLVTLDAERRSRLLAGELVALEATLGTDERLYVFVPLPVEEKGGDRLVLELSESLDKIRQVQKSTQKDLVLAIVAATLAVGVVTALAGHVLLSQPLTRIAEIARRAGEGDFSLRLPATAEGPLGALERDMNAMCERLAESARAVREQTRVAEEAAENVRHAERLASIGKIAAGIAHELGTPLNVIRARAVAIARAPGDAAEVERLAKIVREQSDRMTGIVRQLLDFSRRRTPELGPVDLSKVVRATILLLEPQAKAAEVALRFEPAADVPEVKADASQLEHVLLNLLMNAIQASVGGGDVTVRLDACDARPPASSEDAPPPEPVRCARLVVEDHGVGIPRQDIPRLFDPFFTTKPRGEGTGLGLPVAWGLVQDHGGWIKVESREGEGSAFSVYLPLAGPASLDVPGPAAS
jgi:signal transduction histidine kinase